MATREQPQCYVRAASHAGSWYSDKPRELGAQLDGWLATAREAAGAMPTGIRGVIAPHAGYSYSGPTAAHAFARLGAALTESTRRIVLLGPSHHVALRKCAVSGASRCETPLGNLEVDANVRDALVATGVFGTTPQQVDEDEHSLEMMFSYVRRLLSERGLEGVTVVPIMVGHMSPRGLQQAAAALAPYLADAANLFVVSSDFCHWGRRFGYQPHDPSRGEVHEFISELDHEGMGLIESQDPEAFAAYLERTHNTICGRMPIMLFLYAMRAAERAYSTRFVAYAQSSPARTSRDSSVSYASAVVCEQRAG